MTTNKRRPRPRRSNTPPPPAIGERRAPSVSFPPPSSLPYPGEDEHEDNGGPYEPTPSMPPVEPARTLVSEPPELDESSIRDERARARLGRPPLHAYDEIADEPARPAIVPGVPAEREEERAEQNAREEERDADAREQRAEREAERDEARAEHEAGAHEREQEREGENEEDEAQEEHAAGSLPPEAIVEAEPAAASPGAPTPRWIPVALLVLTAIGVILYVRFRGRDARPPLPVETATASATVSAPLPRIPVISTAEPDPVDRELDDASVLDFEAAKDERKQAVIALEKHDIPKAVDLATQATQHDPQTAEGWIILGAAYIYKGDYAQSQKSFKTCVEVAKIGRRDECAALLR